MRIAHYAPDLWSNGGVATYVRRLATEQTTRGHEALLLSQVAPPANLSDLVGPTGPATYVSVPDATRVYDVAQAHCSDIVHLHKPVPERPPTELPTLRTMHDNTAACPSGTRYLARTGTPCPRIASLPACLWGHAVDGCGSRHPKRLQHNFQRMASEQRVLSGMPVVAVSNYIRQEMIRAGYDADTITVVPSPAPTRPSPLPPSSAAVPHFLFMGRVVPEKGLEWLLRALATVDVQIHLDVAGDGYELDEARSLSTELGLDDRVTFHGWVAPSDITPLLAKARAVVVPSLWHEPAGLVTLEAAAAGRPVIASRVGGIPEYAHPSFSLLVAPNDVSGLASHLTRLASDASLAAEMGRTGHSCAQERFGMNQFVENMDSVYSNVIASASGPEETSDHSAPSTLSFT